MVGWFWGGSEYGAVKKSCYDPGMTPALELRHIKDTLMKFLPTLIAGALPPMKGRAGSAHSS